MAVKKGGGARGVEGEEGQERKSATRFLVSRKVCECGGEFRKEGKVTFGKRLRSAEISGELEKRRKGRIQKGWEREGLNG
jgi:hypothetical protein